MNTQNPKYLSKIQAAAWAGLRVSIYSSASYLVGTIGTRAVASNSQTPDLDTVKGWAIGAAFAGGAALIAFVKNLAAPKSQIVQ